MKISLDWLSDLVSWDDTPAELAIKLTSAGLNVESIEEYKQSYPGVVVAMVLQREVVVDVGSGELRGDGPTVDYRLRPLVSRPQER